MNQKSNCIVIIGPSGVGKTTVAQIISNNLGFKHIDSDACKMFLYNNPVINKDIKIKLKRANKQTFKYCRRNIKHQKGLSIQEKRRLILKTYIVNRMTIQGSINIQFIKWITNKVDRDFILDLAPIHSIYSNKDKKEEFLKIMNKYEHIFYLVPSENIQESLDILRDRRTFEEEKDNIIQEEANKYFLETGFFKKIATNTIYTNNKNPNEIAEVLLEEYKNKKTEYEK